jgi:ATP-dependent DNA ligase
MLRTRLPPPGFIEPCLPTPAERPPSGPGWVHEIKHDGFRMMVRRDPAGVRLLTRNGHDWSARFPLIVQAVGALRARSCLIDGEAITYDDDGLASFELLRGRRHDRQVALCAFDLLELDGRDLRHIPLKLVGPRFDSSVFDSSVRAAVDPAPVHRRVPYTFADVPLNAGRLVAS